MSAKSLVLDFDGTLTEEDVGDAVCARFAPPQWAEVDALWVAGAISLPEAQRRMWGLCRASRSEVDAFVRQAARPRAGLEALLRAAKDRGYRVVVASGGFDFCMGPVLGWTEAERSQRIDQLICNSARFEGQSIVPVFNGDGFSCERCAVCKGKVCDAERARGANRVVFVGDGSSDRCALGRADALAAVRGGVLEATCRSKGAPFIPITSLDQVLPLLD